MSFQTYLAPELQTSHWLNADSPISLASLRGRVVVLHAFQMLCPGCVSHGLPQAAKIRETFPEADVAVIGLHTVFEHHAVTGVDALKAFVHEYRIGFPVGVDQVGVGSDIPLTMQAYSMQGTPSLVLIDRKGTVRLHRFGRMDDMHLGALIGQLVMETPEPSAATKHEGGMPTTTAGLCDEHGCPIPT